MMFGSNLILLLLVNLAFASVSDNVPAGGQQGASTWTFVRWWWCSGEENSVHGGVRWRSCLCPRQDERVEERKKRRRFWPRPFPTRGGDWQEDSTKTFLI